MALINLRVGELPTKPCHVRLGKKVGDEGRRRLATLLPATPRLRHQVEAGWMLEGWALTPKACHLQAVETRRRHRVTLAEEPQSPVQPSALLQAP
jgi:hypothetical protein